MPITSKELLFKYSTQSGTTGDQNEQLDPQASIGGFITTNEWAGGIINDLFDNILDVDNTGLQIDYRCIFIHNKHLSLTLINSIVWFSVDIENGANIALGIDPTPASIINSSSSQSLIPVNRFTAPIGVTFSTPITKNTSVSLGNIPPGFCKAIWFRRTATGNDLLNDGFNINVQGKTLV